MRIIVMKSDNKNYWYKDKVGKVYKVEGESQPGRDSWITKDGIIRKSDCEVIEK